MEKKYLFVIYREDEAGEYRLADVAFCVNELESYLKNSDRVSDYFITDANNDTNKQISDIQDLLSKDIDLLLLQPISPDAVAPIIEEAYDKGVVVVTCASPVGTDKYHASVLAKDEDFGRTGME